MGRYWKCRRCEMFISKTESKKAHLESCGGITDAQAELMKPSDLERKEIPKSRRTER